MADLMRRLCLLLIPMFACAEMPVRPGDLPSGKPANIVASMPFAGHRMPPVSISCPNADLSSVCSPSDSMVRCSELQERYRKSCQHVERPALPLTRN
jgi:hypothetical protein